MMLDIWMKKHGHTDATFGALIGRSRLAVFRYRHGKQVPRAAIAQKIETVTGGEVTPPELYRAYILRSATSASVSVVDASGVAA